MITYRVVFTPEALAQLDTLYGFIATAASPERAVRYVAGVTDCCAALRRFPHRGRKRDDIRPGMRTTHYRRRTVVVFRVESDRVTILGVFHRGQDYEAVIESDT